MKCHQGKIHGSRWLVVEATATDGLLALCRILVAPILPTDVETLPMEMGHVYPTEKV